MSTSEGAVTWLEAAFYDAAASGRDDIVGSLLRAGIDVHAGDDYALQAAAACGQTRTVEILLHAGANPRVGSNLAAGIAESNGYSETAKVLRDWIGTHPLKP